MSKSELHALVADAVVDCYGEDEQASGLYNMIEQNLALPFQTWVLGVEVTVENIELKSDSRSAAVCARGETRQDISLADLPLPDPAPEGTEWIDAYRHWAELR
jgi:Calcium binding